jgi:glycosyltransferase involved in cell wall biosynthesis
LHLMAERPLCVHVLPFTHDAGAENHCRYLLEGLRDAGDLELEVVYFEAGRAHSMFRDLGLPMLHLPRLRRFRLDAYGRARRLRRAYAERPPDLLHTWMPEANVIGLLAARSWPRTRVVITQRGSWKELERRAMLRLQRLLLGRADHAISNSRGGAEALSTLGMRRDRISVIRNGIPVDRVHVERRRDQVRQSLGWEGHEIVTWAGRVSDPMVADQKGVSTLLAAIGSLRRMRPTAKLVILGATRKEIEQLGYELPEWASALRWQTGPAGISEYLHAADALVISSRMEGDANVAGEALLLGLPVATTDCGDHCETVSRSYGCVVPVGDPDGLATATASLLDDPPDRRAVREAAAEALSVRRMVERTQLVYQRLLGG